MDNSLLPARLSDIVNACERSCVPQFLGFLTEAEASSAICVLNSKGTKYLLWGGYADAERKYVGVLPDWCEGPDYPITAITFTFRNQDKLSHRDFLGALMSLGLVREKIGDILVGEGRAVVFVNRDISKFVLEISKIGRVGVCAREGFEEPLPQAQTAVEFTETVASLRLDCVIAAIYGLSRGTAAEVINDGLVYIDSVICTKATRSVCAGNKLNLRGKGRVCVLSTDERSRKGRIILKCNKYI